MPHRPSIYELLATQQAAATTITQLNAATKSSFIDKSNLEFWSGMITVARALGESRTNAHGIVIPETGKVHIETIANGADVTIKPSGTEVWRVENVDADNCTIEFQDADGNLSPILLTAPAGAPYTQTWSVPFNISPTLFLKFSNGSGGEQTPSIAYFKVSL